MLTCPDWENRSAALFHHIFELLFDHVARGRGWTWQRYVITPILSFAVILALILLAFVTSNGWLPALVAAAV
jgi:hypothetical protein